MEVRFYVDDGDILDLRVATLLEKYGFKGTFYIAPWNPRVKILDPIQIKELSEKHEIGGHGMRHVVLTNFNEEERFEDIMDGKHLLEEIIGRPVTKFAVPRGWYNKEVIETVKRAGFEELRTMKQGATERDKDDFLVPISVHFHPEHLEAWRYRYQQAKEKGERGYFGVTCHGWELYKFNLWREYESMLREIYEDQIA